MKLENLPKKIPVFPLSNFIIFPKTTVPLNIFEPRYLEMVDDAMKGNRIIGMIQPNHLVKTKIYLNYMMLDVLEKLPVSEKQKIGDI